MFRILNRRGLLVGGGALGVAWPALAQDDGLVHVLMQTSVGDITLGLDGVKAPITTANFLRYITDKRYDGGTIYRAMRPDQVIPEGWGLIQGGSSRTKPRFPGIAHESTTQTGILHKAGTISLARGAPGTATSDFFLCVGEMKGLDADPMAQGENLGYAAFGHVIAGMDIVKLIHEMPTKAEAEVEAMKGQMLEKPVDIKVAKKVA